MLIYCLTTSYHILNSKYSEAIQTNVHAWNMTQISISLPTAPCNTMLCSLQDWSRSHISLRTVQIRISICAMRIILQYNDLAKRAFHRVTREWCFLRGKIHNMRSNRHTLLAIKLIWHIPQLVLCLMDLYKLTMLWTLWILLLITV